MSQDPPTSSAPGSRILENLETSSIHAPADWMFLQPGVLDQMRDSVAQLRIPGHATLLRETQQQNAHLAAIIQRASQPFCIGYPDGRLGLLNHAFEQLTGYTADELHSIGWVRLTPAAWLEMEYRKLEEQLQTGEPLRYEKEYIRKDGSLVPIELLVHVVRDAEGKPDYYF